MTNIEQAEKLEAAIKLLGEATAILNELDYEDGRIVYCLAQLEGLDKGWYHRSKKEREYLVDILVEMYCEAEGNPIVDHWRGHPLTSDEAYDYFQAVEAPVSS
jgi:hypothetical protein